MSAQIVDDYVVQEHEFDDDDGEKDDFEDDDEGLEHAAEMLRPDKATSSGYLLASGSRDGLVPWRNNRHLNISNDSHTCTATVTLITSLESVHDSLCCIFIDTGLI